MAALAPPHKVFEGDVPGEFESESNIASPEHLRTSSFLLGAGTPRELETNIHDEHGLGPDEIAAEAVPSSCRQGLTPPLRFNALPSSAHLERSRELLSVRLQQHGKRGLSVPTQESNLHGECVQARRPLVPPRRLAGYHPGGRAVRSDQWQAHYHSLRSVHCPISSMLISLPDLNPLAYKYFRGDRMSHESRWASLWRDDISRHQVGLWLPTISEDPARPSVDWMYNTLGRHHAASLRDPETAFVDSQIGRWISGRWYDSGENLVNCVSLVHSVGMRGELELFRLARRTERSRNGRYRRRAVAVGGALGLDLGGDGHSIISEEAAMRLAQLGHVMPIDLSPLEWHLLSGEKDLPGILSPAPGASPCYNTESSTFNELSLCLQEEMHRPSEAGEGMEEWEHELMACRRQIAQVRANRWANVVQCRSAELVFDDPEGPVLPARIAARYGWQAVSQMRLAPPERYDPARVYSVAPRWSALAPRGTQRQKRSERYESRYDSVEMQLELLKRLRRLEREADDASEGDDGSGEDDGEQDDEEEEEDVEYVDLEEHGATGKMEVETIAPDQMSWCRATWTSARAIPKETGEETGEMVENQDDARFGGALALLAEASATYDLEPPRNPGEHVAHMTIEYPIDLPTHSATQADEGNAIVHHHPRQVAEHHEQAREPHDTDGVLVPHTSFAHVGTGADRKHPLNGLPSSSISQSIDPSPHRSDAGNIVPRAGLFETSALILSNDESSILPAPVAQYGSHIVPNTEPSVCLSDGGERPQSEWQFLVSQLPSAQYNAYEEVQGQAPLNDSQQAFLPYVAIPLCAGSGFDSLEDPSCAQYRIEAVMAPDEDAEMEDLTAISAVECPPQNAAAPANSSIDLWGSFDSFAAESFVEASFSATAALFSIDDDHDMVDDEQGRIEANGLVTDVAADVVAPNDITMTSSPSPPPADPETRQSTPLPTPPPSPPTWPYPAPGPSPHPTPPASPPNASFVHASQTPSSATISVPSAMSSRAERSADYLGVNGYISLVEPSNGSDPRGNGPASVSRAEMPGSNGGCIGAEDGTDDELVPPPSPPIRYRPDGTARRRYKRVPWSARVDRDEASDEDDLDELGPDLDAKLHVADDAVADCMSAESGSSTVNVAPSPSEQEGAPDSPRWQPLSPTPQPECRPPLHVSDGIAKALWD